MLFVTGSEKTHMKTISRLLPAALLAVVITSTAFADEPGSWRNHQALQDFQFAGEELPNTLYLARTRGTLPAVEGVTVHSQMDGLFVISGDEIVVLQLNQMGCSVFPLQKPDNDYTAIHLPPVRNWVALTTPDAQIEQMVAQVNWEGISSKIQWLVEFDTRYSMAINHLEVVSGLVDQFTSYGFTPVLRSYEYDGTILWNIEVTQTGTVYPDSLIIVCGHFDSVSNNPYLSAPGADDNGTGTATVLTAAEILSQYDFEYSIRYLCFSGEEQGLKGSQAYASWAAENNLGIVGVLNFDMLGYWEPGVEDDLEIEANESSEWFAQAILNAADLYTDASYELHVYNGAWWGDHASFWAEGYTAVNHEEAWDWGDPDFNPYYHSTSDLLTYIGEDFMVGNVRIAVAALATLAVPLSGSGVNSFNSELQSNHNLLGNPNPFSQTIEFNVDGLPQLQNIRIAVYNLRGDKIEVLDVVLVDGQGSLQWTVDGTSAMFSGAGVYFAVIEGLEHSSVPLKIMHIN